MTKIIRSLSFIFLSVLVLSQNSFAKTKMKVKPKNKATTQVKKIYFDANGDRYPEIVKVKTAAGSLVSIYDMKTHKLVSQVLENKDVKVIKTGLLADRVFQYLEVRVRKTKSLQTRYYEISQNAKKYDLVRVQERPYLKMGDSVDSPSSTPQLYPSTETSNSLGLSNTVDQILLTAPAVDGKTNEKSDYPFTPKTPSGTSSSQDTACTTSSSKIAELLDLNKCLQQETVCDLNSQLFDKSCTRVPTEKVGGQDFDIKAGVYNFIKQLTDKNSKVSMCLVNNLGSYAVDRQEVLVSDRVLGLIATKQDDSDKWILKSSQPIRCDLNDSKRLAQFDETTGSISLNYDAIKKAKESEIKSKSSKKSKPKNSSDGISENSISSAIFHEIFHESGETSETITSLATSCCVGQNATSCNTLKMFSQDRGEKYKRAIYDERLSALSYYPRLSMEYLNLIVKLDSDADCDVRSERKIKCDEKKQRALLKKFSEGEKEICAKIPKTDSARNNCLSLAKLHESTSYINKCVRNYASDIDDTSCPNFGYDLTGRRQASEPSQQGPQRPSVIENITRLFADGPGGSSASPDVTITPLPAESRVETTTLSPIDNNNNKPAPAVLNPNPVSSANNTGGGNSAASSIQNFFNSFLGNSTTSDGKQSDGKPDPTTLGLEAGGVTSIANSSTNNLEPQSDASAYLTQNFPAPTASIFSNSGISTTAPKNQYTGENGPSGQRVTTPPAASNSGASSGATSPTGGSNTSKTNTASNVSQASGSQVASVPGDSSTYIDPQVQSLTTSATNIISQNPESKSYMDQLENITAPKLTGEVMGVVSEMLDKSNLTYVDQYNSVFGCMDDSKCTKISAEKLVELLRKTGKQLKQTNAKTNPQKRK